MGRLPAEVRAMTPAETALLVRGWNEAQEASSGKTQPMSPERFAELKKRYPDERRN